VYKSTKAFLLIYINKKLHKISSKNKPMENNVDSQEQTTSTIVVDPKKDFDNLNTNNVLGNTNTDILEDGHHY
jgi:hypothetical protein